MKKTLSLLAKILVIFILLVIVAVLALVVFINPNDFKPQISSAVYKATGRNLHLDGDIKWSLFPWLGLHIYNVTLDNPSTFTSQPFAKIQEADVAIDLVPLLDEHIKIE